MVLLSSTYLGPIEYWSLIVNNSEIYIEKFENYMKQSWRNRCNILSANGLLSLSIPIKKQDANKILIKDVEIDYATNWQKIHWKAIESAYKSSPFFEFYAYEIEGFYRGQTRFLLDFNSEIQHSLIKALKIKTEVKFTSDFIPLKNDIARDLRYSFHPKIDFYNENVCYTQKYKQVFSEKFGFVRNLSFLDLIFNTGPDYKYYLQVI